MLTSNKIFIALIFGFFGFSFIIKDNNSNTHSRSALIQNDKLEEITSKMKPGSEFIDVCFKIVNEKKTGLTTIYTAKGLYKGKTVGLQFEVNLQIGADKTKKGKSAKPAEPTKNAVHILSLGAESDAFIKAMADLYKIPTQKVFTTTPISCAATLVSQAKGKSAKSNSASKYKLFFESAKDKWDIEILLKIDTKDKLIFLTEVNPGFRKSLINIWALK